MHLLRHLLLSAARHSFSFTSQHVPGVNDQVADALSRFLQSKTLVISYNNNNNNNNSLLTLLADNITE